MKNNKSYELKPVDTTEKYSEYINQQSERSGIPVNHNRFIQDYTQANKKILGIQLNPTDNIIDVGCRGNAQVVRDLFDRGYKSSYGIDIGYEAEKQWAKHPEGIRNNLKRADIHRGFPFPLTFKAITCSHVLEHCYDPEAVIKHFYNALADDGFIHIQIPLSKYGEFVNHKPHYAFWDSRETFIKWLNALGFRVVMSVTAQEASRPVNDDLCVIAVKK